MFLCYSLQWLNLIIFMRGDLWYMGPTYEERMIKEYCCTVKSFWVTYTVHPAASTLIFVSGHLSQTNLAMTLNFNVSIVNHLRNMCIKEMHVPFMWHIRVMLHTVVECANVVQSFWKRVGSTIKRFFFMWIPYLFTFFKVIA